MGPHIQLILSQSLIVWSCSWSFSFNEGSCHLYSSIHLRSKHFHARQKKRNNSNFDDQQFNTSSFGHIGSIFSACNLSDRCFGLFLLFHCIYWIWFNYILTVHLFEWLGTFCWLYGISVFPTLNSLQLFACPILGKIVAFPNQVPPSFQPAKMSCMKLNAIVSSFKNRWIRDKLRCF